MGARLRSFLLGLGPVQRAVRDEVARAIQPTVRSAREALDTHRMALRAHDELVAELREDNDTLRGHNDDLRRRIAELEADNHELRTALAAQRQAAEQRVQRERDAEERRRQREAEQRRRQEREAANAEPGVDTTSDLFCCLDCSSLWLLSTTPDQIHTVRRPVGDGCGTCADQPLRLLPAVKMSLASSEVAGEVARPDVEPPDPPDGARHTDDTVRFVTDLVKNGPDAAIAKAVTREAGELTRTALDRVAPAGRCAGLNAIADGIDRIPKAVRNGIAWCATEIVGIPEFPAKVLSEIVTRAALEPANLKGVARLVRVVGAAACAADDRLGKCPCVRHLAIKDIAEPAAADKLADSLPAPPPPPPPLPLIRRAMRKPGGGVVDGP